MHIGNVIEKEFNWISKHVAALVFHKRWIFDGICTTPKVKSLTNNVKNNTWEEFNLFRFVLIIPNINNKLATMISGIKLTYITVNTLFYTLVPFAWNNSVHLVDLWTNSPDLLFMARPRWKWQYSNKMIK